MLDTTGVPDVTLVLSTASRPKRTMAEIREAAAQKRKAKIEARAKRLAERNAKRIADAAAKKLRAKARRERSMAAYQKRLAADRRRWNREDRACGMVRQTITLRPETPRHVFAERLQDDPMKIHCNHVIDMNSVDFEDMLIAWLDGDIDVDDEVTESTPIRHADDSDSDFEIVDDEYVIDDVGAQSWIDQRFEAKTADKSRREKLMRREDRRKVNRSRGAKIIRTRCPLSGQVIDEISEPMLRERRNSTVEALAAK